MVEERRVESWERWDRLGALAAIPAVVLWVIAVILYEEGAGRPDDAAAAEYLSFYQDNTNAILGAATVFMFGLLFFIWFLGVLRRRLDHAESRAGHLTPVAFASGMATAIFGFLLWVPDFSAGFNESELDPASAKTLAYAGEGNFIAAELTGALFVLTVSLLVLRTGLLPRWIAWIGFLLALVMFVPFIGWAGLIFVFPLWLIAVALLLWMRPARVTGEPITTRPAA